MEQGQLEVLKILGYLLHRLGRLEEAERLFKALLVVAPDDGYVRRLGAAVSLALNEPRKALADLDDVLRTDEALARRPGLLLMKVEALLRLNLTDEAAATREEYFASLARLTEIA
ncbi:MAG: hypothetical protein LBJ64_10665 [Deltaproteobacteria bacterium]|jgi:tetratricopeptide (TPR) repeat protein|nr:hypothetical protein [Deltaproteobacteria bacterium]